ncbi:MAG: spore coat associated protein CotJA [Caulobacteraceae bacterium]
MTKTYHYDHTYKPEMLVAPEYEIPVMGPEFKLAEAYVPYQVFCKVYEPMKGLMKGTIFPELYRPYVKEKMERED